MLTTMDSSLNLFRSLHQGTANNQGVYSSVPERVCLLCRADEA